MREHFVESDNLRTLLEQLKSEEKNDEAFYYLQETVFSEQADKIDIDYYV